MRLLFGYFIFAVALLAQAPAISPSQNNGSSSPGSCGSPDCTVTGNLVVDGNATIGNTVLSPTLGAVIPIIACAGTPGSTTGPYQSLCIVPTSGALYACKNSSGCAVAGDWATQGTSNAVLGFSNLSTGGNPGPLSYVSSAGTLSEDTSITLDAANHRLIFPYWNTHGGATLADPTATTGSNNISLPAGAGQSGVILNIDAGSTHTTSAYGLQFGTDTSAIMYRCASGIICINQVQTGNNINLVSGAGIITANGLAAMTANTFVVGTSTYYGFTQNTGWTGTVDASLSRIAAGVVGVGTGSAGSVAGVIRAASHTATGAAETAPSSSISYGGTTAASTNCGSLSGGAACIVINVAGTTHYIPYF